MGALAAVPGMSEDAQKKSPPDEIAFNNYRMYERARDATGFHDWVEHAKRCNRYYIGGKTGQWTEEDLAILRQTKRPALTINQVLSTCNIVLGEHAAQRMDLRFKPRNANPTDSDLATVVTKVHQYVLDINDYDSLEAEVFADGIIEDRGYFDVRVKFDDNMYGHVSIDVLDNKTVVLDPQAKRYDPETWNEVTLTKWVSIDDIEKTYGKKKADEIRGRASTGHFGYDSIRFDQSSTFGDNVQKELEQLSPIDAWLQGINDSEGRTIRSVRIVERQHKKLGWVWYFVDPMTGDMQKVSPSWDEERRAMFAQEFGLLLTQRMEKTIRWTVSCDGVLLHDGWSPYNHFTVVPYFPYFRSGTPLGLVTNLLDPQDQLNKLASQELHVVNSTANSGWIVKSGALVNMTVDELRERGAETGLVLEVSGSKELEIGKAVQKINPNQIPTGLDRIVSRAQLSLQQISGVNAAIRGEASAEMSGVALESQQARALTQMQVPLQNLMRTRKILARVILSLVQQYYTEERVITITDPTRPEAVKGTEAITINQVTPEGQIVNDITYGKYDAVISSVPSRDTFNDTQFAEALNLRNIGVMIPDDRMVEYSNLDKKYELAEELRQLQGRGEMTPEEQQMLEIQQTAQMRLLLGEVAKLESEVAEIEARTLKLMAEAEEKAGGLDSPEYRWKARELEAQKRIKESELHTRVRLAELSNMNNLDVGVIGARGQQLLERERRTTALLTQKGSGDNKQSQK